MWFGFPARRCASVLFLAVALLAARLRGREADAPPAIVTEAKAPWGRIVMVGASVTAGFTASETFGGPKTSQYVLSRYLGAAVLVPHEPVRNLASAFFFTRPEENGRLQIDAALQMKPTLMVGVDFLFWFCYGGGVREEDRPRRFEKGLKLLEAVSCPLVLGDIPDASTATNMLASAEIPSVQVMSAANMRLKEWAATRPQVVVVPMAEFMRAVKTDAALTIHGRALPQGATRALLQEDELHPSARGCAALALAILDAFQSTRIDAPAGEVSWDPKDVFRRVFDNGK